MVRTSYLLPFWRTRVMLSVYAELAKPPAYLRASEMVSPFFISKNIGLLTRPPTLIMIEYGETRTTSPSSRRISLFLLPFTRKLYTSTSPTVFPFLFTRIFLRVPGSFTPPARYRRWNTVLKDDTTYVPGRETSPSALTWMVLIWPRLSLMSVPLPDSSVFRPPYMLESFFLR